VIIFPLIAVLTVFVGAVDAFVTTVGAVCALAIRVLVLTMSDALIADLPVCIAAIFIVAELLAFVAVCPNVPPIVFLVMLFLLYFVRTTALPSQFTV
jgi:hypothetical protein